MGTEDGIRIVTEIPGPKSRELKELRDRYVARGVSTSAPIFPKRGNGAIVEDVDGNRFVDFAGGIGVLNVGYSHPEVVAAIKEQAERFTHTCFSVAAYEPYVRLAEKLASLTPGEFPKKTVCVNTGAEVIEQLVKIARYSTKRNGVIAFEHAFHGRTLLTMTLTGKNMPYKKGFGPYASDVYRSPVAYCYRCPVGSSYGNCGIECLARFEDILKTQVDPEDIAGVVLESLLGEGGFIVMPKEFVQGVKKLCEQYGILYLADEVQSGFGRTGKMFAIEHYDVVPDIIGMAKSLAAGMPLAAATGRAEIMDSVHPGGLGGTYGGNPVSCAAALAAIDVIERENIVERGQKIGEIVKSRFQAMQEKYPLIGEVRGLGPMVAMELVKDRKTKEPAKDETGKVLAEAVKNGLVVIRAGTYDNVVRVLVPLVISDDLLNQALGILENAVAAASK